MLMPHLYCMRFTGGTTMTREPTSLQLRMMKMHFLYLIIYPSSTLFHSVAVFIPHKISPAPHTPSEESISRDMARGRTVLMILHMGMGTFIRRMLIISYQKPVKKSELFDLHSNIWPSSTHFPIGKRHRLYLRTN